MTTSNKLDKFGQFLVENLRDKGIDHHQKLLQNHWKAPAYKNIQSVLVRLPDDQKEIIQQAFIASIDSAIHDFLFALQDGRDDIQVFTGGENIVPLSDGIHGEPYSDEGWCAKYSKFKMIE